MNSAMSISLHRDQTCMIIMFLSYISSQLSFQEEQMYSNTVCNLKWSLWRCYVSELSNRISVNLSITYHNFIIVVWRPGLDINIRFGEVPINAYQFLSWHLFSSLQHSLVYLSIDDTVWTMYVYFYIDLYNYQTHMTCYHHTWLVLRISD